MEAYGARVMPNTLDAQEVGVTRERIPKAVREAVLREYNHLCAICRAPNPQLHHVDGDHSNNDPLNLLPLCPNHHLIDQHNPTQKMEPQRVTLFRRFKDPAILWPQFEPLFARLSFLDDLKEATTELEGLRRQSEELVAFVRALEMGDFYSDRIRPLVSPPAHAHVWSFDTPASEFERVRIKEHREYLTQLSSNTDEVLRLATELLRYQAWTEPASGI